MAFGERLLWKVWVMVVLSWMEKAWESGRQAASASVRKFEVIIVAV